MRSVDRVPALMLALALAFAPAACGPADEEAEVGEPAVETPAPAADTGAEAADPFEGTHEMPQGTVEMADGRYTYRAAEADSVLAQGTYEIRGDTIRLTDESGSIACVGQVGVYTFAAGPDGPVLTLVEDPCEGRRMEITGDTAGAGQGG